jgi:hypothetical protein
MPLDDFKFDFPTQGKPDLTWGDLTSYAILESDFDQGGHASSSGTPGESRAGLPNLVEQGAIFDTIDLLLAIDAGSSDPIFDGLL